VENPAMIEAIKCARASRRASDDQIGHLMEKSENVLLNYLKDNPQDTAAWLLLLRIECNSPHDDPERIHEYANNILSYDPTNAYALLFLSYASYFLLANTREELYPKLCLAQNQGPKIMAMIEIAKAYHFETRDIAKSMECLRRSIAYFPGYCTSYTMLGELYIKQGNIKEGKKLIEQGLGNIHRLVTPTSVIETEYGPVSIPNFLNEFFAGTTINFVEHARLLSLIADHSEGSTVEH
jgi:tetratricopeptide (TPR) repeat protein